ncbi:hypothetical protein ACFW6V_27040 [Streptomyces sp. NPDC058734]|uniref:hypothetical protein n=1 Tax=Streptomyces sp. NPDC058734 TaxID=3346615 RepID=UPI0036986671
MNHARTTRRAAASLQDLAAARGHRCLTVLPSNASRERVLTLRMPGAEAEFTDHTPVFTACATLTCPPATRASRTRT